MVLLACVVLFISMLAPFYTTQATSLATKVYSEQKESKQSIVLQESNDLEDEDEIDSVDNTDFSTDAQIHHYDFVSIGQSLLTYPRLKEQIHLNHVGELMVPPPQFLS